MTCADLEIALCDYLDGTLAPAARAEVERHISGCAACAELATDAGAALTFMERVAVVEPPPELVTRMYGIPAMNRLHAPVGAGILGWVRKRMQPMLQPRMVMGLSLTILFFGMMARCAGVPSRGLSAADLEPSRVWSGVEDRAHRTWERSVKFYENLRFVYQVQSKIRDWREQQDQDTTAAPEQPADERQLPVGGATKDPARPGDGTTPTK